MERLDPRFDDQDPIAAPSAIARHTLGPWTVQTHCANENINRVMPVFRRDNIGKLPAWEGSGFYIKNKFDAHLIAAAPDLLDYAKVEEAIAGFNCPHDVTNARRMCETCGSKWDEMVLRADELRKAAIAKAEGK